MSEKLINIAIPNSTRRHFTYSLPDNFGMKLYPGQRCIVPFGKREVIGYFIEFAEKKPEAVIKPIGGVLEEYSLFNSELFNFLRWMSEYYYVNIADVLNAALPPKIRQTKKSGKKLSWKKAESFKPGILLGYKLIEEYLIDDNDYAAKLRKLYQDKKVVTKKEISDAGLSGYRFSKLQKEKVLSPVYGLPELFDYFNPRPLVDKLTPNKEQKEAIDKIVAGLGKFNPFLLYGITGSGKTLVYCHAVREILKKNKTALILVPEIALAGTLLTYFKAFFNDEIALLHSGLTPSERVWVWQNIKSGKYKIVIGARSAIFAPLEKLGLIIIDEEHDESYKQDDPTPRFQGRDSAVMRAKMAGIPAVLGSASPSIESFYNAKRERYQILRLEHRPEKAEVPAIRVIDLKEEPPRENNPFFTSTMIEKIQSALDDNQQVILFLNRRGFSPRVKCADCGHTPQCPHCDISLTYHKSGNRLMCHFCGYIDYNYNRCESCEGDNFVHLGTGTQKVEDSIAELFSEARPVRLDSDSAVGRDKAHLILSDFAAGNYNILLGTQMVAKGIDFPKVSLVGVLMADIGLDMPDFRASEKLFAKLIQVSGRSGRGIIPGEVVIQTFNPDTDLIDDAARQDYETFYDREIHSREKLAYPPFSHLVNFRFSGKNEDSVLKYSRQFRQDFNLRVKDSGIRILQLLGPAPCPLYRLRGMYRRHMFIKTRSILKFLDFLRQWENESPNFGLPSSIRFAVDVDPYDMM